MKVMLVGGVRPDWINLAPLMIELDNKEIEYTLVHTGQHYSYFLDKIFFEQLGIREPDYFLKVGSGGPGYQDGKLLQKIDPVIKKEKPNIVLSFSDANPSLFAIVASKYHIKVAHIEAGMRSNDWRMPEEKNRRIIDSIADLFFVPTSGAVQNLLNEGVENSNIFIVGKLIMQTIDSNMDSIKKSDALKKYSVEKGKYILSTVHRPENVESRENMTNIVDALNKISYHYKIPILAFWHPRTQRAVEKYKLKPNFKIMDPIGFFDFVNLQMNTRCTIGDSGGIEEQACWLGTPCVTLRISTERPETITSGANVVIGHRSGVISSDSIVMWFERMKDKKRDDIKNPYITGAADMIVRILKDKEEYIKTPKVWWDG